MSIRTEFVAGDPRIALDVTGPAGGTPLLFLHGIGGNRRNWSDQLRALQPRWRAAAWDARGYGDSEDGPDDSRFGDFAADALRVLDHLAAPRAIVVGLSMGGLIAVDLAQRAPERIAALVLCDTSPGLRRNMSPEELERFLDARRRPLLEGRTPAEIAPELARGLVGPETPPDRVALLVDSLSRLRPRPYLRTIEVVSRHDEAYDLAAIAAPTLVICGEADRLTPPAIGRALAAAIPGATYAEIPRAGHPSNLEQPAAFNAALMAFLERLPA